MLPKINDIVKQEKIMKRLHSKLTHIRENHIHQATSKIVETKSFRVVMVF